MKQAVSKALSAAPKYAHRLAPATRAWVSGGTVALCVLVLTGSHYEWPFAWPAEVAGYAKATLPVAFGILGTAFAALFGYGDSSKADDVTKGPPSSSVTTFLVLFVASLSLSQGACTPQQARDAGRAAGTAVEMATRAHERVAPAAITVCAVALEALPERKSKVRAACEDIREALEIAKDAIDAADRVMGHVDSD